MNSQFNSNQYSEVVEEVTGRKATTVKTSKSNADRCRRYREKHKKPKEIFRSQNFPPARSTDNIIPLSTTLEFLEPITPNNINKLFLTLRTLGYEVVELQESFLFSPVAAVAENINEYQLLFADAPNDQDYKFPIASFVLPGGISFERYPLCFAKNELYYQPVDDLLGIIDTILNLIPQGFPRLIRTRAMELKQAIKSDDYSQFSSALIYINEIFKNYPVTLNSPQYLHILEGAYDRLVRPKFPALKLATLKGNETYGELTPRLLDRIFKQVGLKSGCCFMDLGSGVGHAVAQAALMYNCHAFGIELVERTAEVAQGMVKDVLARCKLWGMEVGKIELACGDMRKSNRVQELVRIADVILINNFKFDFNEEIKNLIQPMKPGSSVVSLKSLKLAGVLRNGTTREGNEDPICEMFHVETFKYEQGDISWSFKGGEYFIHRKLT